MPPAGWFQGLAVISIKKRYPGQAKKVMMGLWGMGQLALTKMFVVVDDDINIQNMDEVLWAITARTDPARDTIIIDNAPTDPGSRLLIVNLGSKLGIDATTKWREEGYNREIQQIAQVDDNTRSYVDKRWAEYGLFSFNQTGKNRKARDLLNLIKTFSHTDFDRFKTEVSPFPGQADNGIY